MRKLYLPSKGIDCFITLIFVCFFSSDVHAQKYHQSTAAPQAGVYTYYINISGINSKSDVRILEPAISKKQSVLSFVSRKFPPVYFMLRTSVPVSEVLFKAWLKDYPYGIEYFGTEIYSKEKSLTENKAGGLHH